MEKENELNELSTKLSSSLVIYEEIIARRMVKLRKGISDNKIESMKTLVRMLIKEIPVGTENVEVVVNLNSYLNNHSDKNLTMSIFEKRENIDKIDNQCCLALTWSMLNLSLQQSRC